MNECTADESWSDNFLSGFPSQSDDDEMANRKKEAMEKVFQIPLIVQQIIEEVEDLDDIKSCRQINSMWMETTTKVILMRNCSQIKFIYDFRTMKYRRFKNFDENCYQFLVPEFMEGSRNNDDDLTALTNIVANSKQFPCSTFTIHEGYLRDPDIQHFFKIVGKSIKSLKLIEDDRIFARELGEILRRDCPNLVKLHLDGCDIQWTHDKTSYKLPKLRFLTIENVPEYRSSRESPFKILEIFHVPNLKIIQGFDLTRDIEQVIKVGKINCVKKLWLSLGGPEKLIQFEMFLNACPQLDIKTLDLHLWNFFLLDSDNKMKWMDLVQKLLDLTKDTLKCFYFWGIENVFHNLNFPQLSQLTQIEINSLGSNPHGSFLKYPYEILVSGTCPNLKVIKGFNLIRDTDPICKLGRIDCVKELDLCFRGLDELKDFNLFLNARPQLEVLKLFGLCHLGQKKLDFISELTGLLEQLLELSKDTLRYLTFDGVGAIFEKLKFPKFSKLKEIRVGAYIETIFPEGTNLNESFPSLKILDVTGYDNFDQNWNWNKKFPPPNTYTGSLISVKTLKIRRNVTGPAERKLRLICPNAKVVHAFRGCYNPELL